MIVRDFYRTRKDGVRLYYWVDALTDENGNVLYEKVIDDITGEIWRKPIARGFKIMQLPTRRLYDDAIDVENAPYTYIETNEKIEEEEIVE
jgi:hypothetical protein